jgi:hypothetical protein
MLAVRMAGAAKQESRTPSCYRGDCHGSTIGRSLCSITNGMILAAYFAGSDPN